MAFCELRKVMTIRCRLVPLVVVLLATAACGGGSMNGPAMGMTGPSETTSLVSVTPRGHASGVAQNAAMMFQFSGPMGAGMEQFFDLHMGDIGGPVVPMTCAWATDRTTLTCTPNAPLNPGTQYVMHIGGGMQDANGRPVEMEQYGMPMGGQWATQGMMGATHGEMPWSMMSPGWRHPNGSFGMVFSFFTVSQ